MKKVPGLAGAPPRPPCPPPWAPAGACGAWAHTTRDPTAANAIAARTYCILRIGLLSLDDEGPDPRGRGLSRRNLAQGEGDLARNARYSWACRLRFIV